ncbi:hypothetical protein WN55_02638 [Dufourea novaeangliae]|uniref:CCHC-type domain-containing protein n=1 Tax=Dufourea novaeangliae TaxID=178035 RepID=A0A154PHX9_DUFNO|nr:hypothetical protein WN55_02638 [Dufourea novaeangliae]
MSFFNSLQQYVSDSVASLGLSPKRFSCSREDSAASATGSIGSTGSVTGTSNTNSIAQQSTPHGYPKKIFLRGLKSEISVRMSSEYSEILNELISRAIIIEKENDAISQMRGSSEGRLEKRVGHSTVHKVQFEQVVCQLCDKFGHIATECWSYETVRSKGNNNSLNKSPQSSNEPDYKQIVDALLNAQQQIPFSQNRNNHRGNNNNEYRRFQENRDNNPRDTKFCRYCRKPGHNIEECRKITYNSNRDSNSFNSQKLQNRSGNLRNSTMTSAPRGNLTARSARPILGEVIESEIVE